MVREPAPIFDVSDDVFFDRLGWLVVAMLLVALGFGLGVWCAGMLEIRT